MVVKMVRETELASSLTRGTSASTTMTVVLAATTEVMTSTGGVLTTTSGLPSLSITVVVSGVGVMVATRCASGIMPVIVKGTGACFGRFSPMKMPTV